MGKLIEYPTLKSDSPLPVPGKNGYTFPSCAYCPPAQLNSLAIKNHTNGIVVFAAVIGVDGKAHDIVVIKPLPDGLTEKAIEAVESWRLNPAKGPDENPVAARQATVVSFHVYR